MYTKITDSARSDSNNHRLPRSVIPSRYDLQLKPDLKQFIFAGSETIEIEVLEPVDCIVLNANEIAIQEAYVFDANGTRLNGTLLLDSNREMATISFQGELGPGSWKLKLSFTGTLNDKLKGFYRSSYMDAQGKKHYLATTQFESTDARRAFPCFDEPDLKASFKVTLVVDENLTVISNGRPLRERAFDEGKKAVEFAETMKMSTYLVAFMVGEFVSSRPVHVNGVELRIWAVPGKEHLTGFALRSAAFAVDWYERRYGIPYPGGDKIDFVAVPDFAAGAMENLGCITFRESALLVDAATASQAELERVDEVVKHELAHMWFGDLVTMRWWNGLWLNESFATHESHNCMDAEYPHWQIWNGFGLSRASASRVDGLKSTHPIECAVNHPDEVAELFDVISYEKGCSVLKMLEAFIGTDVFVAGVSSYLKKHAYGNTETHDLWDCLEAACLSAGLSVPVRKIMDAWVFTAGHPLVSVSQGEADGLIELSQRQFRFLPDGAGDTVWPIPVVLRVEKADGITEEKKLILTGKTETIFVGKGFSSVVINAGGSGFYRVVYSAELTARILTGLQKDLTVIERFNLANDTWSCVRAGIVSSPDYLEMVRKFTGETDPNVWSILIDSLKALHYLVDDSVREKLDDMVRELAGPALESLGWSLAPGEALQTRQLRGRLVSLLGTIGEDSVVRQKAVELFDSWKKDKSSIDSNLLPAVVHVLAYSGDKERYEEFWQLYKAAGTPQEMQRFLNALGDFQQPELIERTVKSALSEDVRTQDAPYLLREMLVKEAAKEAVWKFIKERWDDLIKAYPDNAVVRMVGSVASLDTAALEADVVKFFVEHKVKSGDMAVAQALEQLRINVAMRQRESSRLTAALTPPEVHLSDEQTGVKAGGKKETIADENHQGKGKSPADGQAAG